MQGELQSIVLSTNKLRVFTGTDQAANTEVSEAVPAGKTWELLCVTVSLVQGNTQTPQPTLIIDDGTTTLYQSFGASSAQSADTTTQYTWAPGLTLTAGAGATVVTAPLPYGLVLPAGYRIRTSTGGKGANSNYGAPAIFVLEYDDGA